MNCDCLSVRQIQLGMNMNTHCPLQLHDDSLSLDVNDDLQ